MQDGKVEDEEEKSRHHCTTAPHSGSAVPATKGEYESNQKK
jgi:hypothetical protein